MTPEIIPTFGGAILVADRATKIAVLIHPDGRIVRADIPGQMELTRNQAERLMNTELDVIWGNALSIF